MRKLAFVNIMQVACELNTRFGVCISRDDASQTTANEDGAEVYLRANIYHDNVG
jgi:hypothetical protein